jgi:rhodanese-related sulfurtransferase
MIPLVVVGGLAALTAYTYFGQNLISSEEAKRLIKEGKIKVVIDVRTATEWRMGHYPKALHIPVDKINEKTVTELPKRGLLVYCNTGQRARFAAEKLEGLGFKDVYYIAGLYTSLL